MTAPTSCPAPGRLREMLDGTLPEPEQGDLTRHLDTCAACRRTLDGLAAGGESWSGVARQLGSGPPATDPALREVMEEIKGGAAAGETEAEPAGEGPGSLDFLGPADKPGQLGRLGPYQVVELIGRGGMGVVLKAFDPGLNRFVAVKVLAPQLATSAAARKRFRREGKAAAAVAHEHVVTIHAVDEANGLPYLVMQYVGGVSLQERLDRSGPLEVNEVLRIGMQTAAGLAAAHAQGLVHRDIKPANILLENGIERVKITDFGLARAADDAGMTQSGVIAGTPQYMAPEQARGEPVDPRTDLFSLGSVLYALCTGRPPFRASSVVAVLKRVCEDTPRPIRQINPDVPEWLAAIIDKLQAKDPGQRFQSASEVADLLARHLAHLQQPSQVPMPPPLPRPAAPPRRSLSRRLLAGMLPGCFLCALVMMLAYFFPNLPRYFSPGGSMTQPGGGGGDSSVSKGGDCRLTVFNPDPQGIRVTVRGDNGVHEVIPADSQTWARSLPAGHYTLKAVKGGRALYEEQFRLKPGQPKEVRLPLRGPAESGWVPLFNGKDLTGWKTHPAQPGDWAVEDGVLVGRGPKSHLFSEREFENFHLRVEAKVNKGGNSGVYFRCGYSLDLPTGGWLYPSGYEAQIFNDRPARAGGGFVETQLTGSLYNFSPYRKRLVKPDEWFMLELFVEGNHVTIAVNGTTTADFLDEKHTYTKGHLALQQFGPETVVHFRKIDVKELPPSKAGGPQTIQQPVPANPVHPFALATASGGTTFATLADAVAEARKRKAEGKPPLEGFTIVVRGNGPFVTPPINYEDLPLTIRAGEGRLPVLQLAPEHENASYLLGGSGHLVLEGLELRRKGTGMTSRDGWVPKLIFPQGGGATVSAANCRLVVEHGQAVGGNGPVCRLRNCDVRCSGVYGPLGWTCRTGARVSLHNCLVVAKAPAALALHFRPSGLRDVYVRLTNNTLIAHRVFSFVHHGDNDPPPQPGGRADRPPVQVELIANALDGRRAVLEYLLSPPRKAPPPTDREALASLPHFLQWVEQRNLYGPAPEFLSMKVANRWLPAKEGPQEFKGWLKVWRLSPSGTGSVQGPIPYEKELLSPQEMPVVDYRLRPPDRGGPAVGIDVTLVGPGSAYDRWKKSPESKYWLTK